MNLFKRYSVLSSLIISCSWIIVITLILSVYTSKKTNFLMFGPSNKTIFIDLKIDTWEKWFLTMVYSFLSQCVHSYINSTLYPFMVNVIRDYKSEWNDTMFKAQMITLIYKLYYWFHEICEIFLVLTLQLQYYLPSLLADIIVGALTTRRYIKDKTNDFETEKYYYTNYNNNNNNYDNYGTIVYNRI